MMWQAKINNTVESEKSKHGDRQFTGPVAGGGAQHNSDEHEQHVYASKEYYSRDHLQRMESVLKMWAESQGPEDFLIARRSSHQEYAASSSSRVRALEIALQCLAERDEIKRIAFHLQRETEASQGETEASQGETEASQGETEAQSQYWRPYAFSDEFDWSAWQ